ncbi:MAG: 3-phosphoshikimate 1-carboxyvinyltransferase, partial [Planctomycetota bacterium]|nr:3-phosphoshikimate 1-carboxyvinyltransferase [Planctomycetota bacterium]
MEPCGPLRGEVEIPGSKSYTNRALLIAALASGTSTLRRPLHSDDTRYMVEALRELGISVKTPDEGKTLAVGGRGGGFPRKKADLFVGNSGTTIRFLTAGLCAGRGDFVLDGIDRMRQRPIQDLIDGIGQLGGRITSLNADGCPPVRVVAKGLSGGRCLMPGTRSSQYFSAILMAAPLAENPCTIQ